MKSEKPHILLVIWNPVGGIRTYVGYVYETPEFRNARFTMIIPQSHLSDLFISTFSNLEADFVICKKSGFSVMYHLVLTILKSRVDLVHSHGFTSGIYTSVISKIFRKKQVITAHDVIRDDQVLGIKGKMKALLMSVLLNFADFTHCVSYDVEKNLEEKLPLINKGKLITISNGVDVRRFFNAEKTNLRDVFSLDEGQFLIGFFGRFMPQKGFEYLIEAVEIIKSDPGIKQIPVVIAYGEDGFIREKKQAIEEKGLSNSFIFPGRVKDTSSVLKGFDVIAMPSLWEACGLVAMEALTAGVPIIACNCIGLREVIEGTPSFVATPANAQDLADNIKECMANDRRVDFASYQRTAFERFDSLKTAKEVRDLYENMGLVLQ